MIEENPKAQIRKILTELWCDTLRTSGELFKIMVPAIIITRVLDELGLIIHLSQALDPIMGMMGLPGSLGIVWATALITSPYSAIAVFASLAPGMDLSGAQVTVLCSILLIAHSLPLELSISRKAGGGVLIMGLIRLIGAFMYGVILNGVSVYFALWQEPVHLFFKGSAEENDLFAWAIAQIINLGLIFLIIFCILTAMQLLRVIGFLELLERLLKPILPLFGMTHRAAPVTVVGMILGLGYGGALIIRETTTGSMNKREIFNSLALMGLSHGLIEDTLVMMAIGGKLGGILFGRVLFSLIIIFLLDQIYILLSGSKSITGGK